MRGKNVGELDKLIKEADKFRDACARITTSSVDVTQVNTVIETQPVVLLWNFELSTWEVSTNVNQPVTRVVSPA
jgi:hypothetical protein